MTAPRTVRARIAVAVTPDGKWNACGYHKWPDREDEDTAIEGLARAALKLAREGTL